MISIFKKIEIRLQEDTLLNIALISLDKIRAKFFGILFSYRIARCGSDAKVDGFGKITGGKKIEIGHGFVCGHNVRIQALCRHINTNYSPSILIGDNVNFNDFVHIASIFSVVIGDNCLIASKVIVTDHNHSVEQRDATPIQRGLIGKPIVIKNNVWIGENVVILPGVTIGEGAIIGANSVVNCDVPANATAVGVPARILM